MSWYRRGAASNRNFMKKEQKKKKNSEKPKSKPTNNINYLSIAQMDEMGLCVESDSGRRDTLEVFQEVYQPSTDPEFYRKPIEIEEASEKFKIHYFLNDDNQSVVDESLDPQEFQNWCFHITKKNYFQEKETLLVGSGANLEMKIGKNPGEKIGKPKGAQYQVIKFENESFKKIEDRELQSIFKDETQKIFLVRFSTIIQKKDSQYFTMKKFLEDNGKSLEIFDFAIEEIFSCQNSDSESRKADWINRNLQGSTIFVSSPCRISRRKEEFLWFAEHFCIISLYPVKEELDLDSMFNCFQSVTDAQAFYSQIQSMEIRRNFGTGEEGVIINIVKDAIGEKLIGFSRVSKSTDPTVSTSLFVQNHNISRIGAKEIYCAKVSVFDGNVLDKFPINFPAEKIFYCRSLDRFTRNLESFKKFLASGRLLIIGIWYWGPENHGLITPSMVLQGLQGVSINLFQKLIGIYSSIMEQYCSTEFNNNLKRSFQIPFFVCPENLHILEYEIKLHSNFQCFKFYRHFISNNEECSLELHNLEKKKYPEIQNKCIHKNITKDCNVYCRCRCKQCPKFFKWDISPALAEKIISFFGGDGIVGNISINSSGYPVIFSSLILKNSESGGSNLATVYLKTFLSQKFGDEYETILGQIKNKEAVLEWVNFKNLRIILPGNATLDVDISCNKMGTMILPYLHNWYMKNQD